MTRKIVVLNLALLGLIALAGWQLRREWLAAQAREAAVLQKKVKPVPPPPAGPSQAAAPLTAAGYNDIAQKNLFSKDRNPVVVVEAAPPPPPKPMPPLPVFHGVMNLGDGPIAIMSESPKTPHREYRPGQPIGPFTLVSVNSREVVLDWEGKQVAKAVEELTPPPEERQEVASRTEAPPPQQAQAPKVQSGPGVDIGKGVRACVPNDSTPAGAVVDGMRKVVSDSPFGPVCRWEAVR